ncbi:GtrA family protein [Amycolatopsis alkalitolerans]|uniref:GtrA family protein n=1 Tax=Amycolatopsis alkalitolerans TaxID=2547244 RepID=A0A5C4M8S0_9PSEU|nr:GtrA family protein [Amycolatopsis alkalitolerans]TNC28173.1 GtrA family protein [Amycolatopsis alkalitolerans]
MATVLHDGGPRVLGRITRALASSVLATGVSQITLLALLGWGHASPALASTLAFLAGAVPNYLLSRRWAWGRRGRPRMVGETLPYVAVIAAGGLASVGLTTFTGWLIGPLALPHVWSVVVLDAAYLASYVVIFAVKFALLDRVVFRMWSRHQVESMTRA